MTPRGTSSRRRSAKVLAHFASSSLRILLHASQAVQRGEHRVTTAVTTAAVESSGVSTSFSPAGAASCHQAVHGKRTWPEFDSDPDGQASE